MAKVALHRPCISARLLDLDPVRMNFKATTHEGLGPVGPGEGMAAQAVVLIERPRG